MRLVFRGALGVCALACFSSQGLAVTVNNVFMTKGPPDNQCNPQPAVVSFAVTDADLWIYVNVSDVQVGDVPKIEFLDGSGAVALTNNYDPLNPGGRRCLYGWLTTPQHPAKISPGIWTAHGTWNGVDLFRLNFVIAGAGGPPAAGGTGAAGASGVWQLTTTCSYYGNATLALTEAADGSLSGTVSGNQNKTSILADAAGYQGELANAKSLRTGNSLSLILHPEGWISVLALTGTINGNQVSGNIHHYGNDDCTFSMVRATGAPGQAVSYGAVLLLRLTGNVGPGQDFAADLGAAVFAQTSALSGFTLPSSTGSSAAPACLAFSGSLDLSAVLAGGLSPPANSSSVLLSSLKLLDAGTALSIAGPKGSLGIAPLSASTPGIYFGFLSGSLPVVGGPALPPFLDPGSYTVSGVGGANVGPFSATTTVPASKPALSNAASLAAINRSAPATWTWTGGDASQIVLISGVTSDQTSKATGAFFCLARADALTLTVPSAVLEVLPPSGDVVSISSGGGLVLFVSLPTTSVQTFTAQGLDLGLLLDASADVRTAVYQ